MSGRSDGTGKVRFVIIGAARTGAGWLGQMLQAHREVSCAGRLLAEDEAIRREAHLQYHGTEDWMLRPSPAAEGYFIDNPRHYLRRFWDRPGVVGFRSTYDDISHLELWPVWRLAGCRVIHVTRNPLAALVSQKQAGFVGVWGLPPRKSPRGSPAVRVEPEVLRQRLVEDGVGVSRVEMHCPWKLEIGYRQLIEDLKGTWARVCEFLKVSVPRPPNVSTKCQRGTIRERLLNWAELQQRVPRHEWLQVEKELV